MMELLILVVMLIPALLGLAIPALAELVTKVYAPDGVKSAVVIGLALLLSAVVATPASLLLGATLTQGLAAYFTAVLTSWLVSGRAYLAGLANKAVVVRPEKGIGPTMPEIEVDHGDELDQENSTTA